MRRWLLIAVSSLGIEGFRPKKNLLGPKARGGVREHGGARN
jgi:hypothetical protein